MCRLAAIMVAALNLSLFASGAAADQRRTPIGSHIPQLVNPGLPPAVWASLFAGTTPSGKRLELAQLRPLIIQAPAPNGSFSVQGHWPLKIGMFLLHVRPDGTVAEVEKLQSNGHPLADLDCITTFGKWRFRPNAVKEVRVPAYYVRTLRSR